MNQDSNRCKGTEEREISVTTIFWEILHGWRLVLVGAIIFALLLAGVKYLKDASTMNMGSDNTNSITVDKLSAEDQKVLVSAETLQKQLENREDYVKSSVLMKVNPYQKDVVTLQYYVDNGYSFKLNSEVTKDDTTSLINAYISYVMDSGLLQKVCKSLDWDMNDVYVAELIDTSKKPDGSTDMMNQNAVFSVYLTGIDDKKANQLADAVEKAISDYQITLQEKIGAHQLRLVDRYVGKETDISLADKQNALESSVATLKTQLNTMMSTLSPEQKQLLAKDDGTDGKTTTKDAGHPSLSKKYIVLGAFAGVFLACVWIVLTFVLDNRLKTVQELENFYNVRIFGKFAKGNKKKRLFSGVDKWLESLQHKDKATFEQQRDMTLMNLKMTCKQQNIQHLFMTNTVMLSEQEQDTVNSLIRNIRALGITVDVGEDILHNADSFEKMVEIGNIILIEKTEETYHNVLEQELRLCEEQRTQVLGVIAFE